MFVHVQEKVSKELEHTNVNCDRDISSVPIHCLNPLQQKIKLTGIYERRKVLCVFFSMRNILESLRAA